MNKYIKQQVFDETNIKLFYLSPYAEVKRIDDDIVLMRQESETAMFLPYREEKTEGFIKMLSNGIEENVLLGLLSDLAKESEDWLYGCMCEGIIE